MGQQGYAQGLPRSQARKSRSPADKAFTIYRPLENESALELHEMMQGLHRDGMFPTQAEIRPPEHMRVTYVERSQLTRQLQGVASTFNAFQAFDDVWHECDKGHRNLEATLGRAALMDRRDNTVVARIEHNQIVASEFEIIADIFTNLNIKGMRRKKFRPHVSLVKVNGLSKLEKRNIESDLTEVLPKTITLAAMQAFPFGTR